MIQEIHNYLQQADPDFESGFGLLCKYSPNESIIAYLARTEKKEMLLYELAKLDESPIRHPANLRAGILRAKYRPLAKEPDPEPTNGPSEEDAQTRVIFKTYDERRTRRADLPSDLQDVYDSITSDYKLRRALHEKMKAATAPSDRAYFREEIINLEAGIRERWNRIDNYLADAAKEKVSDTFSEKNCRAYISKALKAGKASKKVAAGVRARLQALIEHGCTVTDEMTDAIKNIGIEL